MHIHSTTMAKLSRRRVRVNALLDNQCSIHVLGGPIQVTNITVPDVPREIDLCLDELVSSSPVAKLTEGGHDFALRSQRRVNTIAAAAGHQRFIHQGKGANNVRFAVKVVTLASVGVLVVGCFDGRNEHTAGDQGDADECTCLD